MANVLATSIITTLPPVQTHAAENKLKTTAVADTAKLNPIFMDDTTITGTGTPNLTVTITLFDVANRAKYATKTVTIDAAGKFSADSTGWVCYNPDNSILTGVTTILMADIYNVGLSSTGPSLDLRAVVSHYQLALDATKNLFISNNPVNDIKTTTDQAAVDAAQALVNLVTDASQKAALQKDIDKAQQQLTDSIKWATTAKFNPIFTDDTTITGTGTPDTVAMVRLYDLTGVLYADKMVNIDATGKFSTDSTGWVRYNKDGSVLTGVTTIQIANLKGARVAGAPGTPSYYDTVNVLSHYQLALDATNNLFISNDPVNNIKTTTDQAAVDAAQSLVNLVTDASQKAALQKDIDKAQQQLTDSIIKWVTTAKFNPIFTDDTTITGTGTPNTMARIVLYLAGEKYADKTVNIDATGKFSTDSTGWVCYNKAGSVLTGVTTVQIANLSGARVGDQTKTFDSVNVLSHYQLALDATNNLFISNDPANHIKGTTDQAAVDAAQALVNLVTDASQKAALQKDIDKAQAEINATSQLAIATATVNALFADAPTNSVLKDTTTQAMIDAAKAQVDALPSSVTEKAKLIADVNNADSLFNKIAATTINTLTADSTSVSGKGEPNSAIVIKNGSTTIASGKTDSAGNYSFIIAKQASGATIVATVTKASNYQTSSASTVIPDNSLELATDAVNALFADAPTNSILKDTTTQAMIDAAKAQVDALPRTAPEKAELTADVAKAETLFNQIATTTIENLTTDSTTVSGKGEPNSAIVIKNGSTTIASGKTDSAGNYSFIITKQAGGSTITATITKASNSKTSTASTTIADDSITQTTIGALTTDSTSVSGKGEPNSAIVIKNGSTTIASGNTDSAGNYNFIITKQVAGSVITATVTKASNNKTSAASISVASVAVDYSLTAKAYKVGDANLTGTYGKNISKVRLFVNGTVVTQATTASGSYTFKDISSFITKPTDKVEVVGVDGSYVERARIAVAVTGDPIYDYTLSANDYTLGSATLTGKYGKDVSKVRLWVNGVAVSQAVTNSDGTYTFDKVPSFIKLTTDKVEVVAVNAAYKEVARTAVVTKGSSILDTSLTAAPYAKGSANLTGTFGKDISKVRLWVNGVVVQQASTSNGAYTFTNISKFIVSKDDVVEVVGVDAQYNERNRITVTKTGFEVLDNALTGPATFTLDTGITSITGNYGANVSKVRLSVNGVIVKQASTASGVYTLAGISTLITKTTDLVEIVAVDAQYKEVNRIAVSVQNNPIVKDYSLTVNPYTIGSRSVTGSFGADIAYVRLAIDGVNVKTAILSNGTYTINGVDGVVIDKSHTVEIVATDAKYKEVKRITVSVN
ncbi:toxin Cry1Ac domain D-VI-related protein [Listeria cornellensis]|uniref:Bacterial Ig domain-containing protein n=1 Tax=Listeria cornellensis FSL F6-0969 TaxID=1265820 RepID=W7C9W0_9LIST|nr:toxin Cry1Ac domain D-VI-related protein [Listeria cornellensis]EUJ32461.1 hypothetical protein PCORN_00655 [Listeria cornellensis FSL F6-0969]